MAVVLSPPRTSADSCRCGILQTSKTRSFAAGELAWAAKAAEVNPATTRVATQPAKNLIRMRLQSSRGPVGACNWHTDRLLVGMIEPGGPMFQALECPPLLPRPRRRCITMATNSFALGSLPSPLLCHALAEHVIFRAGVSARFHVYAPCQPVLTQTP